MLQLAKPQIIPTPQETDEKISDKINSQTQLPLVGNKTFVQKKQQTPVYHYPKNTAESPIYNYFADGQKYLHQDESAQERGYFMKGSESPNKPMQTGKKDGVQTPNYRDFDFFNQQNSPEKVTSPNKMTQLPFQMKNAFNMDDFQAKQMNFNNNMGLKNQGNNFHIDLNNDEHEEEEENEFDQDDLNQNEDNDFNPLGMKGKFNMKGMNQGNFGNMRQNNNQDFALLMNSMNNQGNSMGMLNMNMNQMGQGQMSNQNMNMMPPYFGNDFMNQQQMNVGKLNKEDYLFEKFGKRGWQCIRCNNFNFESNIISYNLIARNKCNKCGLPMTPKLINKNRRDDFFNPDDKKKKPLIERKGDWLCPKCRNLNFAFRLICNRCQLPKSDAGGQMPFQNNMGNQRGFNPQNSNFNFKQGNNFPSSLLNPSNINIYNNYYNFTNLKTDVGNGNNMLSYMNKINGPQKGMGMNDGSPNFGNFNQFSNFDPKSLDNIINNPHSMKPGDFNLNLHQHDLEEDDSSEDDGDDQHHI